MTTAEPNAPAPLRKPLPVAAWVAIAIALLLVVFAIGVLAVGLLVVVAMRVLSMDYVPDPETIRRHPAVASFLVNADSLQGVYGNYDIDSMVFRYTTTSATEEEFWKQIDDQAAGAGWTKLPNIESVHRYERFTLNRNKVICGTEEVRIRMQPDSKRVDVAWVQGDSEVSSFSETHESDWAETEIWHRMDEP